MDEQLVAFLRDLIETRNTQLEKLIPRISAAAQTCVATLTGDSRIFCWGNLDCYNIANIFSRQLLHQYRIERPALPCLILERELEQANRQIKALPRPGDLLLLFCSSEDSESVQKIQQAASERNLKWLTIGDIAPRGLIADAPTSTDDLAIYLDVGHKAQVLDSQLAIALSLAGLIDHLLFGSEL